MKVHVDGDVVTLRDGDLLGEGGEGRVYARGPREVLKIYLDDKATAAPGADPAALRAHRDRHLRLMALRAQKLPMLAALSATVGAPALVLPRGVVTSTGGAVVGYRMARVTQPQEWGQLVARRGRAGVAAGTAASAAAVLAWIATLHEALLALHARGVVVGDLNDGNVLVAGGAVHLIDLDAAQVGALPCPVAHQRALDPRLYGVDLLERAVFAADNDLYALRVLLFAGLTGLHPYGGTHPQLPTLLRRAEARHSALRDDVTWPKNALSAQALPDDLLHDLARCFDGHVREPLDVRLLRARFAACKSCGLEHARARCPACATAVPVPAVRTQGGVQAVTLNDRGVVLAAGPGDGPLDVRFVVDDGTNLVQADGTVLAPRAAIAGGVRVFLSGSAVWLVSDDACVRVEAGRVERTSAARGADGPLFCASALGAFRVHGDVLVHHDSGAHLGRVVPAAARVFCGDAFGLVVSSWGNRVRAQLFGLGKAARDVNLPVLCGRLVDVGVRFGGGRALIGVALDHDGRRLHHLLLIDDKGALLAQASGCPDDEPWLASLHGACLAHGKVLLPTAHGVRALGLHQGVLDAGTLFSDTRGLVDESCLLFASTGGALVVQSARSLTRLVLVGAPVASTSASHNARGAP